MNSGFKSGNCKGRRTDFGVPKRDAKTILQ